MNKQDDLSRRTVVITTQETLFIVLRHRHLCKY